MEKFKEDPMAMVSSPEYSKMMTKASEWTTHWVTISVSCSRNITYQEKMKEIGDGIEERMKKIKLK